MNRLPQIKTRNELARFLADRNLLLDAAEIGVAEGRFSANLVTWGFRCVYLVDLWAHVDGGPDLLGGWSNEEHDEKLASCLKKLEGHEGKFRILRGWSTEMAKQVPDESLGFCYIDATHQYEWVLRDLKAWYPKLVLGGVMAGHDYLSPSFTVKPAVDEFASDLGIDVQVIPEKHINDASFWLVKPHCERNN